MKTAKMSPKRRPAAIRAMPPKMYRRRALILSKEEAKSGVKPGEKPRADFVGAKLALSGIGRGIAGISVPLVLCRGTGCGNTAAALHPGPRPLPLPR